LNNGTEGQQSLTEIEGRVEEKKKDCKGRRNREEGLQNKNRDRHYYDY